MCVRAASFPNRHNTNRPDAVCPLSGERYSWRSGAAAPSEALANLLLFPGSEHKKSGSRLGTVAQTEGIGRCGGIAGTTTLVAIRFRLQRHHKGLAGHLPVQAGTRKVGRRRYAVSNDVKIEQDVQQTRQKIEPLLEKARIEVGRGELSGFCQVWKQIGEILGFEVTESAPCVHWPSV